MERQPRDGRPALMMADQKGKNMKFENLFNIMHCDFFEVHKDGKIEKIDYEISGKMLKASKKYFNDTVKEFYTIRSKNGNGLGLMIIL